MGLGISKHAMLFFKANLLETYGNLAKSKAYIYALVQIAKQTKLVRLVDTHVDEFLKGGIRQRALKDRRVLLAINLCRAGAHFVITPVGFDAEGVSISPRVDHSGAGRGAGLARRLLALAAHVVSAAYAGAAPVTTATATRPPSDWRVRGSCGRRFQRQMHGA